MLGALGLAREACIHDPVVLALLVLGNLGIAVAYVWIPASIMRVALSIGRLPAGELWWLFGAFIVSCGATHACAVLVIFRPAWYLEATLCVWTAMVSLVTAAFLQRAVPELRRLFGEFSALERDLVR